MIFFDMDGVCCNFVLRTCEVNGFDPAEVMADWTPGNYDIHEEIGISKETMWQNIDRCGVWFWRSLPVYGWFNDLVDLAVELGHDMVFVSSPAKSPDCHAGKAKWIKSVGYCPSKDLVLCSDKWMLAGLGRILIDDSDTQCRKFIDAGGVAITFPQPWNSQHAMCGQRMRHVRGQLTDASAHPLTYGISAATMSE